MKFLYGLIFCLFTCSVSLAQTYTLDHYLDVAKNNSPLLKDLHNQVASNSVDSLRLLAGLKPQVNANSGGLYAPVIGGYGYASAITNEHTLNALMSANKTIIGKKNINAQLDAITLQSQSIGNTTKISEQDLKKAITTQYITAYGDLLQVRFNQEVIALLSKEEDLLKKLTRANVYRQSDYLTFLVTLKQQQLALLQARLLYKNDYSTLNYLAGVADTSMIELAEPVIQKPILPDPNTSIFFRQYKLDSLKLVNSRQLVDFSYKPKLSVTADGGYNSDFMGQAYKNFGVSAGFTFTMPIYDGGQRKMQYRKISLEEDTRQNYKAFFNVQFKQQIAQLNQQISENDNLLKQIDEQIKYTESLVKVDSDLLQTGDVRIADLILAINNYLTIKNLRTTTNITKLQLINQLNYYNR
ncbi:TolC family protein [Mucilaginibacter gotjawali]|uniref:Outer membrane efflux protein n=2 Tax=Mucilaginibacter gotjawali TaxID=1550579 RepID=A0A0X8X2T7_9SPHI|nr:TolC family protein [Mucilaginibacter gotjawali]MBB3057782.1 outer membrane protein TolC [Mucilaginibacter gotjawali]BAU52584.1 Outer membrane efflux protein [Mucilaginibacter gotjawali]